MLYRIDAQPQDHELASALLWASGATGIEERATCLIAGFDAAVDLDHLDWPVTVFTDTEDWVTSQRAAIGATEVGPFLIHPPWVEPGPTDQPMIVMIDPGAAFGHGGHETTALCLVLLSNSEVEGRTVADLGCGTGVLGICAALLGADKVWGTDVDPAALAMTRANATANGVDIEILDRPPDADLTLVNVTIDVHEVLAPDVAGPELIVSGVLADQVQRLESAYEAPLTDRLQRGGWVAGRLLRG